MKIPLFIGFAFILFFGSEHEALNTVDLYGVYQSQHAPQINLSEHLHLRKNGTFEYRYEYNSLSTISLVYGSYQVNGRQIHFFPLAFEYQSGEPDKKTSELVFEYSWIDQQRPESYKSLLGTFESGLMRLKPNYTFKKTNKSLSLCRMTIKDERYWPVFEK